MVINGVQDADDVRAAAAEAAIPLLPSICGMGSSQRCDDEALPSLSDEALPSLSALWADGKLEGKLWESLGECDELSSSTAPVLNLLARLLERGGSSASQKRSARSDKLQSLWMFVRHQLASVRLATAEIMAQLLTSWGKAGCKNVLEGEMLVKTLEVTFLSLLVETRRDVRLCWQSLWIQLVGSCDGSAIGSACSGVWGKMIKAAAFGSGDCAIDPSSVCSIPEVTEGMRSASSKAVSLGKQAKTKAKGGKAGEVELGEQWIDDSVVGAGPAHVEAGGSDAKMTAIRALSQAAARCDQEGFELAHFRLQEILTSGSQAEKFASVLLLLEWATMLEKCKGSSPLPQRRSFRVSHVYLVPTLLKHSCHSSLPVPCPLHQSHFLYCCTNLTFCTGRMDLQRKCLLLGQTRLGHSFQNFCCNLVWRALPSHHVLLDCTLSQEHPRLPPCLLAAFPYSGPFSLTSCVASGTMYCSVEPLQACQSQ